MCSECFIKYVSSKPVKRIESYRLKDDAAQQPRRLLLPVSGGISSVVLLQILDQSLQRQLVKRGRTAYELLIVTVESPWLENERNILSCFHALRQKFSLHHFSLISLTSIVELDHNFQQDVAALSNIARAGAQDILDFLVSNAVTPSARTHLINALLTRLVAAFAEFNKCDAVLWGHSSSCLAAKSLAAVVEGNGGALPLHISDGPSFLGVPSYFPLRDLLSQSSSATQIVYPNYSLKLLLWTMRTRLDLQFVIPPSMIYYQTTLAPKVRNIPVSWPISFALPASCKHREYRGRLQVACCVPCRF